MYASWHDFKLANDVERSFLLFMFGSYTEQHRHSQTNRLPIRKTSCTFYACRSLTADGVESHLWIRWMNNYFLNSGTGGKTALKLHSWRRLASGISRGFLRGQMAAGETQLLERAIWMIGVGVGWHTSPSSSRNKCRPCWWTCCQPTFPCCFCAAVSCTSEKCRDTWRDNESSV